MTARVGYFTANVTEDPGRVAGACQMLRPVESTHVTPDGQVLCILEGTGLRDEDEGFGSLERAVRGMKGVEDVEAHGMPFAFSPDAPFEVLDAAVGEAIERTKPAVPGHDGDQGVFAADMRAWVRTAATLRKALRDMTPDRPLSRDRG